MFMIEPRKLDSVLWTKGGSLSPPPGGLPLAHRASKQRNSSSEGARRAEFRPVPTGRPSEAAAAEIALRPTGESRPTGRAQKISRSLPPPDGQTCARRAEGCPTGRRQPRALFPRFSSGFSLCLWANYKYQAQLFQLDTLFSSIRPLVYFLSLNSLQIYANTQFSISIKIQAFYFSCSSIKVLFFISILCLALIMFSIMLIALFIVNMLEQSNFQGLGIHE